MTTLEGAFFEPFKERRAEIGDLVDVYRNLNIDDGYSIRSAKSGLVLAHCSTVTLKGCTFKVSEAGRRKTVEESRRRVHAYVRGTLTGINQRRDPVDSRVYYNPFVTKEFIRLSDETPVTVADQVHFEGRYCYVPSAVKNAMNQMSLL